LGEGFASFGLADWPATVDLLYSLLVPGNLVPDDCYFFISGFFGSA